MREPSLWAVVLAGGIGSRFWPASTPQRPKQLLPLVGDQPLIQQTIERVRPIVADERIRVLTGGNLVQPILGAVPGLSEPQFLVEPIARGTAPVLAWAAAEIERLDPGAVMVSLHADHVIAPASAFRELLVRVSAASKSHRRLFTIGAVPNRPETGYGYIRAGAQLPMEEGLFEVAQFVEKPGREDAQAYVAGGYLWNTGIFVWPAALLIEEIRRHTPEVAEHLPLLAEGRVEDYFARVPPTTIDEGLLERSDRVAVARATFDWDDVGTWDAIARTREGDSAGNVGVGDAIFVDSERCVAWSEEGSVVLFGATDLVVVRTSGITFVAPRDRAPDLKNLLEELPARLARPEEA